MGHATLRFEGESLAWTGNANRRKDDGLRSRDTSTAISLRAMGSLLFPYRWANVRTQLRCLVNRSRMGRS